MQISNVLLVAPESGDLAYAEDSVRDVYDALNPIVLWGKNATSDKLIQALADASNLDLLWLATYGNSRGVKLRDGYFPTAQLIQQLRGKHCAVFIDICTSLGFAIDIHHALHIPVICTVSDMADPTAARTAAAMARQLGAGQSLADAYELASPGDGDKPFRMLNGDIRGTMRGDDELMIAIKDVSHWLYERMDRIELHFSMRIDDVETSVNSRFDRLIRDVKRTYQARLTRLNLGFLLAGYALFVACMWLFYSDIRAHYEISMAAAAFISIVAFPLVAALLALGMGFRFDSWGDDDD